MTRNVKTDESIVKVVSAKIRRSSMNYDLWKRTQFWHDLEPKTQQQFSQKCVFEAGEIPILGVMISEENWSVFSSRFIHYSCEGIKSQVSVQEIETLQLGDFKGYSKKPVDFMRIQAKDGAVHPVIYETGKPSMGAIYAVRTLLRICGTD